MAAEKGADFKIGAPLSPSAQSPKNISDPKIDMAVASAGLAVDSTTVPHVGYPSSMINLLKTIIGGGMLALPFAFKFVGIIPGVFLMVMAAAMAVFGLHLLSLAAEAVGRTSSFSNVCHITYPRASFVVDFAIAIKCLGVGIAYLSVVMKLFPKIVEGMSGAVTDGILSNVRFWLVVVVVLISPVTFMRNMDSLKYTSFFGLVCVAYMLVLSVYILMTGDLAVEGDDGKVSWFASYSAHAFRSVPTFIFAFACHQNIFPIYNESKNNSQTSMMVIVSTCVTASAVIYTLFSLTSYCNFGALTENNVLINYPTSGTQYILARLFYAFLLICSYPLQTFPCRVSIGKMVAFVAPDFVRANEQIVFWTSSIGILIFTGGISAFNFHLTDVLGLVGSTASPILCYFLPAILYLKLVEKEPWTLKKHGAVGLLVCGCFIMIVGVWSTFKFWGAG